MYLCVYCVPPPLPSHTHARTHTPPSHRPHTYTTHTPPSHPHTHTQPPPLTHTYTPPHPCTHTPHHTHSWQVHSKFRAKLLDIHWSCRNNGKRAHTKVPILDVTILSFLIMSQKIAFKSFALCTISKQTHAFSHEVRYEFHSCFKSGKLSLLSKLVFGNLAILNISIR